MPATGLTGSATSDLGLGGTLADQVAGETEEQRKKRMAALAASKQAGMGTGSASAMLLGTSGGLGALGNAGY
jgi:hypothetical protein